MSACGHVSMELLTVPLEKAGPYWTALEKAAAAHAEDAEVALSCISGFAAPVANDQLAPLVETGRAIETIAKVLRKHPQSAALQGQGLQALGGALLRASPEALSKWRDAGGIKMFVDAMVLFQSDPAVSSQIFGGVQYVAHNPAGVRDVVNIGAPLQGIRMLMKRLHETPNNEALTPDGTSLKCQILATLDGIIMNDADNSWSDLALERGLMKELVYTMRKEKHRQTQNIGCANMLWLAVHNKSNHLPIIMDGGIQMMAKALADFNWVDSTPFMGTTVSETFNIQATCPDALKVLAIGGNGASKVMAKAGLVKTLITMPEELKTKGIEELMGLMCWAGACLDFDNQHTQIIGHKGAAGR